MKIINIKKGREVALARKHPWVFSGALYRPDPSLKNGDHVEVKDYKGNILAVGHYSDASIAIRILHFGESQIDLSLYKSKIKGALDIRNNILHLPSANTNCYRLIAGEGDLLPGLIIDIYDQHAVVQCHTAGMLNDVKMISDALDECYEGKLKSIYLKAIHIREKQYESMFLKGDAEQAIVLEHGLKFHVDWTKGQKTGFFLDQRDNRNLIKEYAKNKNVLNTFCYTGGFSVYALEAGAKQVDSIDISSVAMEQTDKNVQLNQKETTNHNSITGNVMELLKDIEQNFYDLIILDPPAFAKNRNKSHNAVQAYKRLNLAAIQKISTGGIIFSFSCSQVVDRTLFENTIRAAAIESGKDIRILKHLNQAPDHIVNVFHQEGHYLKGLVYVVI